MKERSFEQGFTNRSVLAILFSSICLLPVSAYMQLVGGATLYGGLMFITLIVFSEIFRLLRSPLTRQELFIIYEMSGLAATSFVFIWIIRQCYYVQSPISWSFRLGGVPIPQLIPSWWAPPISSSVYVTRELYHHDLVVPSLLACLQGGVFMYLTEFALTMIFSYMFIEVEKLEFPLAVVDASICSTLAERPSDKMRLLILSAFPGMVYGSILYGLPLVLGQQLIPIPWIDFTKFTEKHLPGALLGIGTDISVLTFGFLIPFSEAVYMFASSVICWIFINSLALSTFSNVFPEWASEYFHGMNLATVYQRSYLTVWIIPSIGFSFALAAILLPYGIRGISRAFKELSRVKVSAETGYPELKALVGMYLLGTIGSVATFHLLVPEFPVIIPLMLSTGWSLVNAMIATRAMATTGYSFSAGPIWNVSVYASGYQGVKAWIFTPYIGGSPTMEGGTPGWSNMIKAGYLTGTRPVDFFKALVVAIIAYHVFSYIYASFFWKIAPIPSSVYPNTVISWPIDILSMGTWITGKIGVKLWLLLYSFAAMVGICLGGLFMSRFLHVPFSPVAVVTGALNLPPYMIPMFIGSMLNRFVIPRFVKKEYWRENRGIIIAGLLCGESIVVGIGIAASIASKATWIKPY